MGISVSGLYSQTWRMKQLLASCPRWQTLCSVPGDYAAALPHIAIYYGQELVLPYPRIILHDTSEGGARVLQRNSIAGWSLNASVHATIEIEVDRLAIRAETLEDEGNWFTEQVGQLVREMAEISHSHTLVADREPLAIQGIAPIEGPDRIAAEERQFDEPAAGQSTRPLWTETLEITLVP